MIRRPPRSTRTDTLFPYTTLFRSLPNMVYASVRRGPPGSGRLVSADVKAGQALRGVLKIIRKERWIAAVGESWWAANRALNALKPRFETRGPLLDNAAVKQALQQALRDGGDADAIDMGDDGAALGGRKVV